MTQANPDLVPIWQEIDKRREEHKQLEIDHAKTLGKVELLTSKIDQFNDALKDHRSESKEGMTQMRNESREGITELRNEWKEGMQQLQVKQEELLQAHQVNKGKELTRREIIWIVATLGSLALAVWQVVT